MVRIVFAAVGLGVGIAFGGDRLADGFRNPHQSYGPETWWHWMNGNVSREGIVADLDAMAAIGLSGVHIFDAGCGIPPGELKFNTPDWFETVRFAVAEAQKRGLRTTLANCSGYSTAGGPWITPENSMKTVRYSVKDVTGPCQLTELPLRPEDPYGFYEDIAVLAYPIPSAEEESLRIPECPGSVKVRKPFAATTLELRAKGVGEWSVFARLTLEARNGAGTWRKLVDERISFVDEGMRDYESRAFPFPETQATEWRVTVSPIPEGCSVLDVRISRAGRVPNIANKALFVRTCDGDAPYEVGEDQCVKANAIRRIPVSVSDDVSWDVPPGRWRILRMGHAANGKVCHPASDNGVGFECDKLSKRGIGVHFDSYIGRMCDFLGPELAGDVPCGFNNVLVDSWEAGSQNWTHGLEGEFLSRKGYDLIPYLPIFAGAVVENRETTERVLADFRDVVANLFAENFSDEFARKCHARGLKLSIEPYGSFPAMPDLYARASDIGMCEFWVPPAYGLGDKTVRLVSDYYHARDPRKIIAAESFTGKPEESRWQQDPYSLKAVGDKMYSIGVNRIVYHRYAHQPWTAPTRYPGMTMGQWGTHFERTETWWYEAKDWIRYQTRCQYLLQSGDYVSSCREEPVRWLERKYEDGSRAFFLACSSPTAVTHTVELPFAQGEPELWDPESGDVVLTRGSHVENGRTYLDVEFKPSGSVFVVFRPVRTHGAKILERFELSDSLALEGPWSVSFKAPYANGPKPVVLESLKPLNEYTADDVRYFSGTAIYRLKFDWTGAGRARIDLGAVKNLATVVLNGREYPVLWRPPFSCEITDALREGANELEVRVTNLWVNRLIGDERLDADVEWDGDQIREVPEWVRKGLPSPTDRHTFTTWHHWRAGDRLLESGLIGPVTIWHDEKKTDRSRLPVLVAPGSATAAVVADERVSLSPLVSQWHGVNLLGLYNAHMKKPDPRVRGCFEEKYFRWLHEWGFNFARLPMDYRHFVSTNDWTRFRTEGLAKVDQAVAWGRKYKVHVQLCLHRAPGYTVLSLDPERGNLRTDKKPQDAFIRIWTEFARRYRGIGNDCLSFNLVNEPTGFSEEQFIDVFDRTIAAIRRQDPDRFVMLDGNDCASVPVPHFYRVPLTGQAFRGYTPHAISHYKAWYIKDQPEIEPNWPLSDEMARRKEWIYEHPETTLAKFAAPRVAGYPVMIGEFGCYNKLPHETCLAWMESCLKLWQEAGLGWAIWNVDGQFGFMDSNRADVRYEDFEGHRLDRRMLELLRKYATKARE